MAHAQRPIDRQPESYAAALPVFWNHEGVRARPRRIPRGSFGFGRRVRLPAVAVWRAVRVCWTLPRKVPARLGRLGVGNRRFRWS